MTRSERRLITFIAWSGTVLGSISTVVYLFGGYWFDSFYGALAVIFFSSILYMTSKSYISYDRASILFSAFKATYTKDGLHTPKTW